MTKNITVPQEQIAVFCRKHPIRRLSLFGSPPNRQRVLSEAENLISPDAD